MIAIPAGLEPHDIQHFILRSEESASRRSPFFMYQAGRQDWPPEKRFQLQLHKSKAIIRAVFTGNGSGKSTAAAIEANWWAQGTHPYQLVTPPPVRIFWVALKYKQMDELRSQLESTCLSGGWRWLDASHRYKWPNGSTLSIISNDADWGGVQGTPPDLVIIDEECDEKLWTELTMRRRGGTRTRYLISATATKGKRWMHRRVYAPWLAYHQRHGMDEETAIVKQIHPRIWCWPRGGIADNPGARPDDLAWYTDALELSSAAEREVRLHGGFLDFNAQPVFDHESLNGMELVVKERETIGVPGWMADVPKADRKSKEDWAAVEFCAGMPAPETGWLKIYEQPKDDYYVLGADFSYGLASGDYDAAVVLRQKDARQVAAAFGHWGDATFSWLLWKLCIYYRNALLVGERQVGLISLRRIYDEYGYRRIYHERDETKDLVRASDTLGHHKAVGDLLVPHLVRAVSPVDKYTGARLRPLINLTDSETISQCRAFEWTPRSSRIEIARARNEQLKQSAPSGEHDDLVMAAAYGWMGLRALPRFAPPEKAVAYGTAADILKHEEVLRSIDNA